jgi:hypothetical protein
MESAWKEETPVTWSFGWKSSWHMCFKRRSCTNPVLTERKRPAPRHRYTSAGDQTQLLIVLTIESILSSAFRENKDTKFAILLTIFYKLFYSLINVKGP